MNDAPRYATLRDYLRVLREQWLVLVAMTLVAGAVAFFVSQRQDETYRATATVAVEDQSPQLTVLGGGPSSQVSPELTPQARAQTLEDAAVAARVKRRLGTDLAPAALQGAISTAVDPESQLVEVAATSAEPAFAAALANAFATEAVLVTNERARRGYRTQLRRVRARGRLPAGRARDELLTRLQFLGVNARPARVLSLAGVPAASSSQHLARDTALGFALGLALGLLVAFARDSLDHRIRGSREIEREIGLPVLGHVRGNAMGQVVSVANGSGDRFGEDLEAFRILRQNLEFLGGGEPLRSVLVTSPLPEEGKSTVASSLACAIAATGRRTLLVECDLRKPTLAKRLGIAPGPGLSDYLAARAGPQDVVQAVELAAAAENGGNGSDTAAALDRPPTGSLFCITAGTRSARPAELLKSDRLTSLLAEVREAYEQVILDAGPLLPVADALELVPRVDGVLLCLRSSRTTREQVRAAKAALGRVPGRPVGLVVTGLSKREAADYGYYSSAIAHGAAEGNA